MSLNKPSVDQTLRFLLVGKTGSGKSSTGNTILGGDFFASDKKFTSVTTTCTLRRKECNGTLIEVMVSPGLFDTSRKTEEVAADVVQALACLHSGITAVLYVIRLGSHYMEEDTRVYERLKALLDPRVTQYMIIIFTRGDDLKWQKETIGELLLQALKGLRRVLRECNNRYVVFDNMADNNQSQVEQLLEVVHKLSQTHGGQPYTCPKYSEIGVQVEELARRMQEVEEKEVKATTYDLKLVTETKKVQEKAEREKNEIEKREKDLQQKQMEIEKQRKELERKEDEMRKKDQEIQVKMKQIEEEAEKQRKVFERKEKERDERMREKEQEIQAKMKKTEEKEKKRRKAFEKKEEERKNELEREKHLKSWMESIDRRMQEMEEKEVKATTYGLKLVTETKEEQEKAERKKKELEEREKDLVQKQVEIVEKRQELKRNEHERKEMMKKHQERFDKKEKERNEQMRKNELVRDKLKESTDKQQLSAERMEQEMKTYRQKAETAWEKERTEMEEVVPRLSEAHVGQPYTYPKCGEVAKKMAKEPEESLQRNKISEKPLCLLLVGKNGSDQCSTENILGQDLFDREISFDWVTATWAFRGGTRNGTFIEVIDCSGLFNIERTHEEMITEVVQVVACMHPGPTAVLYAVMIGGDYTDNEMAVYERLKAFLDPSITEHMLIVFFYADNVDIKKPTIDDILSTASDHLRKVVVECGHRYVVFDNKSKDKQSQVDRLLREVRKLSETHGGKPYTCSRYRQVGKKIEEQVARILQKVEEEMEGKTKKCVQAMEEKMTRRIQGLEEKMEQAQAEVEKVKRESVSERDRHEEMRKYFEARTKELETMIKVLKQQQLSTERMHQEGMKYRQEMEEKKIDAVNEMERRRKQEMETLERRVKEQQQQVEQQREMAVTKINEIEKQSKEEMAALKQT